MPRAIEVFADITCPFTHVGLSHVANLLGQAGSPVELRVRAWPLEWVNGSPMDGNAVATKAAALREKLQSSLFAGTEPAHWPGTTIPALNLAAAAYQRSSETGLVVSLEIRDALFEQGLDISDTEVLAAIAASNGLDAPGSEPSQAVLDDYAAGQARGVKGSPDFFIGEDEFFCPALDLGHDESGELTASFDLAGLDEFMSAVFAD